MNCRMMIGFLCVVSIVANFSYAHESNGIRKIVRIAWYAAQTGAGYCFLDRFHRTAMSSLYPCDIIKACWRDKRGVGSCGVASVTLLWHGLSGLDRELRIREFLKRQFKTVRNK